MEFLLLIITALTLGVFVLVNEKDQAVNIPKQRPPEWRRKQAVNEKRHSVPCRFHDGLSSAEFEELAMIARKKFERIKEVTVSGAIVICKVESVTGKTEWFFRLDFNDWGHVTGARWMKTENENSLIPHNYGKIVSELIHQHYRERGIVLRSLSDFVDNNRDLETAQGLNYSYRRSFFDVLFRRNVGIITMNCRDDELVGEHLYPVISLLIESGIRNIRTVPLKDINDRTPGFPFQVAEVEIQGNSHFEPGMSFLGDAEAVITYREKQTICMPYSQKQFRKKHYTTVIKQLSALGFTRIYESQIPDVSFGLIVKDGSVDRVLLEGNYGRAVEKTADYEYDQKIVVYYHTRRR